MAFEKLRSNRFDEEKKEFCMNCGAELTEKDRNYVTRRFCSVECHETYLKPRSED